MKKGIIIWIIILIALWAAWSRYYIKNNWEKTIVYEKSWIVDVQTLKWWKIEKLTTYYKDWTKHIINYKNWVEDWEEISYYPNWNIKLKTIWKKWYRDHTKEAAEYYEDWSYKWISTPEWLNTSYYENWQIEKEYKTDEEGHTVWIEKSYNEEWELIAEWEYKDWKKYNWTFVYIDKRFNENYEHYTTKYIEEYKDWELIDKQVYDN